MVRPAARRFGAAPARDGVMTRSSFLLQRKAERLGRSGRGDAVASKAS